MCDFRIGQGYDVHQIAEGLPMWLCGVRIPGTKGFVAHSDGDVAIHALCDALLGSLALGDIGHHFPDSSEEFRGIDSRILLRRVMEMIDNEGFQVGNVDITIALQSPKIGDLVPQMRETLAPILNVGTDRVSIKATSTERLGFVGREEGCGVWASVITVKKKGSQTR